MRPLKCVSIFEVAVIVVTLIGFIESSQQRQRNFQLNQFGVDQRIWMSDWTPVGKFDDRQLQHDHPLSTDQSGVETWLSSSYLTPPPRPRRGRLTHHSDPGDIYDYLHYDKLTYSSPNLIQIYQNHFQTPQSTPNSLTLLPAQGHFNRDPHVQHVQPTTSYPFSNHNLVVSVPVENNLGEGPLTTDSSSNIISIDMDRVINDLTSVCSHFLPEKYTRLFCPKSPSP